MLTFRQLISWKMDHTHEIELMYPSPINHLIMPAVVAPVGRIQSMRFGGKQASVSFPQCSPAEVLYDPQSEYL